MLTSPRMELVPDFNTSNNRPEVEDFLKLYDFEKWFNHESFNASLERNWTWILYLSAFYIYMVHHGQRWMANRKSFELRRSLIIWNFSLVIFSAAVCVRMLPELGWQCKQSGFYDSLCRFGSQKSITQLWGVVFAFSKVVEFGDTAFLVLNKKPIIFLHWYHHATVAIYGFYVGDINDPASRWFVLINSLIHTIMYAYYGFKAMGVNVPKKISVTITSLQISQMIFGIYINVVTYLAKASGVPCERSHQNLQVASVMYASYLVLFANFFYKSYVTRKKKTGSSQQQSLKKKL